MFGGCAAGQPSMQAAGLPACLIRSMLAPESRTSNARAPAGQAGRHTQPMHARRPGAPEALVGASPPLHAVVVCVCVVTGHTLRRGWCVRGVEWPHEYAPTINAKLQPRLTFSQAALTSPHRATATMAAFAPRGGTAAASLRPGALIAAYAPRPRPRRDARGRGRGTGPAEPETAWDDHRCIVARSRLLLLDHV